MWLRLRRPVITLPSRTIATSGQVNPDYEDQVRRLLDAVDEAGGAILVDYGSGFGERGTTSDPEVAGGWCAWAPTDPPPST